MTEHTTTQPAPTAGPASDGSHDGYTSDPTHLRIFREDQGDDWPWHLDGVDDDLNYTDSLLRFATHKEAIDAVAEFIADTTDEGVTWHFAAGRQRGLIRRETPEGVSL